MHSAHILFIIDMDTHHNYSEMTTNENTRKCCTTPLMLTEVMMFETMHNISTTEQI